MAKQALIALYTDADVTPRLARLLREQGFDSITAHEVGNANLGDGEHLAYAANHGCAILTYNGPRLRAYPNNPDARKAIKAQAKCRKAI